MQLIEHNYLGLQAFLLILEKIVVIPLLLLLSLDHHFLNVGSREENSNSNQQFLIKWKNYEMKILDIFCSTNE